MALQTNSLNKDLLNTALDNIGTGALPELDNGDDGKVVKASGKKWGKGTDAEGGEVYSTTETKIGTWNDGVHVYNLYRKVTKLELSKTTLSDAWTQVKYNAGGTGTDLNTVGACWQLSKSKTDLGISNVDVDKIIKISAFGSTGSYPGQTFYTANISFYPTEDEGFSITPEIGYGAKWSKEGLSNWGNGFLIITFEYFKDNDYAE